MAQKRAAVMDAMRADRGVAEPAKASDEGKAAPPPEKAADPKPSADAGSKPVPPSDAAPSPSPSNPSSPLHNEWLARERAVAAAEKKVKDASTAAEARSAQAQADEAKAKQALTELAAAKNEPVEFLAKVGMTQDEWQHFMSQGGKMSPEAKRLKAIEARFTELEGKYEAAQRKAEESARRAAIETENMQFGPQLGSYPLLSRIGGIQAIRNKQAQVAHAEGAQISLDAAAKLVEKEMRENLIPLLKHDDVRRTLNLQIPDQPNGQSAPPPPPENGAASAKTSPAADPEDTPAPWDWAAKKRLAKKLIDLERKKQSAL